LLVVASTSRLFSHEPRLAVCFAVRFSSFGSETYAENVFFYFIPSARLIASLIWKKHEIEKDKREIKEIIS
jgi:hypothetical protein